MSIFNKFVENLIDELSERKGGSSGGGYSGNSKSYFDRKMDPLISDLMDKDKKLDKNELNKIVEKLENKNNFKIGNYSKLNNNQEKKRLTFLAFAYRSLAKKLQEHSEKEYLSALEIDDKDTIALEYLGELYVQTSKLHEIGEKEIYAKLFQQNAKEELSDLHEKICEWNKNVDKSKQFIDKTKNLKNLNFY